MKKKTALKAIVWSGGDLLLRQGAQFVTFILLARFLTPTDFGLVAMLTLVSGVAGLILDGGLSSALIQKDNPTSEDEASVFFFNISLGILMAGSVYFSASWVANFYNNDALVPLVHLTALGCFLAGFLPIHVAILTRKLDFVTLAKAGSIASILSGSISVLLASRGYGAKVLVLYPVMTTGLMSLILWRLNAWRPQAKFSSRALAGLARFGIYHMGAALLDMIFSRLHTPLLGRLLGAQPLGLYIQADNLRQLPSNFLGGVVARVAFPLFSKNSSNGPAVIRGFQLSVRIMMLINAPVMIALVVLAEDILYALMGASWIAAASLLRILAIAGIFYPLHVLSIQLLLALGYSEIVFKLQLWKNTISVVFLIIGLNFGLEGVAWSQVALSFISIFINSWHIKKFLRFGALNQLREALPPLLLGGMTGFLVWWIDSILYFDSVYTRLMIKILAGAAVFLFLALVLQLNALKDAVSLVKLDRV